ncbi:TolC family protein [Desulfopila aestuarii]|uniref:Outer membrane protein TolC n=1 Tax=Desulfopila aestuarii DSM 18488 TaxID=1121416 RepID=A0A1M7YAX6_9BACT|nr:TolC family protein [Desulfopila aestuarii]SHO49775.1 Outer membrane protein TolC [Desulfopila aestuarii DSM 18488]
MFKTLPYYLVALMMLPAISWAQAKDAPVPLTLKTAVETALANNLNLTLRREDTNIAAGAIDIAKGRFDKQFNAETGVEGVHSTPLYANGIDNENSGRLDASITKRFTTGTEVELGWTNSRYDADAFGIEVNPSYRSMVELGISQPLLRGWGTEIQTGQVTAAEIEHTASTFQVNSTAADLAALVKRGYWNLVFSWQDIEVKKFSVSLARKLLAETEAKIAAGALAEVEIYQPQSEVTRREEDLIAAELAIGLAEDELKLLLNSSDWLTPFAPTDTPSTEPVTLEQKKILQNALANRPDLKAAKMSIDAARIRQTLAEDDLRPALSLAGRVGYGGLDDSYGDALDAALDDPDTEWQVGLQLSIPLDNTTAKGSLQQARALHAKAKTSAQLLELEITKSVRTTVRDIELAIKGMEATRKTSLATKKRLEAEQAKFDAGRSTTLDVLIAQESYARALSQENRTAIFYVQALAELDRIQGFVTLASAQ